MGCLQVIAGIIFIPILFSIVWSFPIGRFIFIIYVLYLFLLGVIKILEKKETKNSIKKYQKLEYTMDLIDNMNGQEFESFLIKKILPNEGYYKIKGTTYTGDYGVDIIAYKDDIKCAIQCKRFNNKVTNKAIQEVVAGRKHYKCEKAIVITNNYYTKNAQELAFDNQVELLNRDNLIKMVKKMTTNE